MEVYFHDKDMRYIGHRELKEREEVPLNAVVLSVDVKDGQEAFLINNEWVVNEIIEEPLPVQN